MVCVFKTLDCILSTDLLDHVPDVINAGKPAAGMYLIIICYLGFLQTAGFCARVWNLHFAVEFLSPHFDSCLLYTSDAADE